MPLNLTAEILAGYDAGKAGRPNHNTDMAIPGMAYDIGYYLATRPTPYPRPVIANSSRARNQVRVVWHSSDAQKVGSMRVVWEWVNRSTIRRV